MGAAIAAWALLNQISLKQHNTSLNHRNQSHIAKTNQF